MSSTLQIVREPKNNERIIKVAITANGNRVEQQGELFDWSWEGKVVDVEVGEKEHYVIRNHINNIWTESMEDWSRVDKILQNGLMNAGIPEGYQVCAFLKDSPED